MSLDLILLCAVLLFIAIWGWLIHQCFPAKLLVTPGDFLAFLAGGLFGLVALPNLVIWMLNVLRIEGRDFGFLVVAAIPSGALIGAILFAHLKGISLGRPRGAQLQYSRKTRPTE